MEDLNSELQRLLVKLDDPNKIERKKSLEKIKTFVEQKFPNIEIDEDNRSELISVWQDRLCRPLIRAIGSDSSERVREISAEIVLYLLDRFPSYGSELGSDFMKMAYLFPLLQSRLVIDLGEVHVYKEPSEEVRLLLVKILSKILEKCLSPENISTRTSEVEHLRLHMDEIFSVLRSTILDNFADVKEESCNAVLLLDRALPKSLSLNGPSSLLEPLTRILAHQQKKIRIAAINAIGVLLLHGSGDDFQKVGSHLAQRLFDSVPQVRRVVSLCAGNLLLNWRYGESNAPLLVPLLLTSIEDALPETQQECRELWDKVGNVYIEKLITQDERLKEKMDFVIESGQPKHYPSKVIRPSFGCRQYVTRIISKLLPALKNDFQDWLVETRIKASQLLIVLLTHLEEMAVVSQYAENLLNLMQIGTKDSERIVVENMARTAEIYGYFVPPTTWCPMITERLLANPSQSELMILSKVLDGSDPELLKYCLEDLVIVLQDDSICLSLCSNYLAHLLACVDAILTVSESDCLIIRSHLFKIGISILALAPDQKLKEEAREFLQNLATTTLDDVTPDQRLSELFRHEMTSQLKAMRVECRNWVASSFRLPIFSTLILESGPVVGYFVELVVGIFCDVLTVESIEPELQLKMFIVLSKQLYETSERIDSQNRFGPFALRVLEDLILPALTWHAGKKASAVRTAAASSLWSLAESGLLKPETVFGDPNFSAKLFPIMSRLVEDDSEKTRIFVVKAFKKMFDQFRRDFPAHFLLGISSVLLKRLEDVSDDVRLATLHSLSSLNDCLPAPLGRPSLEMESHLKVVCSSILLHMDDSNVNIRNAAFDTLTALSKRCPALLTELTETALSKHSHQEECRRLIEHLKTLSI